jgi:hypothetical protein
VSISETVHPAIVLDGCSPRLSVCDRSRLRVSPFRNFAPIIILTDWRSIGTMHKALHGARRIATPVVQHLMGPRLAHTQDRLPLQMVRPDLVSHHGASERNRRPRV